MADSNQSSRGRRLHYDISFNGYCCDSFRQLAEKMLREVLVPIVKKNIVVTYHEGRMKTPEPFSSVNDVFYLRLYSRPFDGRRDYPRTPTTIWGIPVETESSSSFCPSGETQDGSILYDDKYAVAEILPNHIYIYHKIGYLGSCAENDVRLLREIIMRGVSAIKNTSRSNLRWLIQQARRNKTNRQMAQEYAVHLQSFREKRREELRSEVINLDSRMRDLGRQMAQLAQRRQQISADVTEIGIDTRKIKDERRKLEQDFRTIEKTDKVRAVVFNKQTKELIVFTDELISPILSDGTRRRFGRYKIIIRLNPDAEEQFLAINLSRRIDGYHHPHSEGKSGNLCLGNIYEGLYKLLGAHEYTVAVQLLLQFLQAVNVKDWYGERVWNWPVYVDPSSKKKADDESSDLSKA